MADFNNGLAVNGPLTISDEVTASVHFGAVVKAIIDDCSRHTDGGAWRKQCQGKSWFTEALGGEVWIGQQASIAAAWAAANSLPGAVFQATATAGPLTSGKFYVATSATTATEVFRGISRDYPDAVLWVAEAGRVVGYDMTKPGYPMWMVFVAANGGTLYNGSLTTVNALNGQLVVGSVLHLAQADFASDYTRFRNANGNLYNANRIANRNAATGPVVSGVIPAIVNQVVNDVAITVLDTAPTDPATGLPVPTIAVACGSGGTGGVSVIRDDGTVASLTLTANAATSVSIVGDRFAYSISNSGRYLAEYSLRTMTSHTIATMDATDSQRLAMYAPTTNLSIPTLSTGGPTGALVACANSTVAVGGPNALNLLRRNPTTQAAGMVAYITNAYNSGWLPGDIRGAYLADSVVETITATSLITGDSSDFAGGTVGAWSAYQGGILSVSTNRLLITNDGTGANSGAAYLNITTVAGRSYVLTYTAIAGTSGSATVRVGTSIGSPALATQTGMGTYSLTFVATTTSTFVTLYTNDITASRTALFDDISVKLAEPDRSVKNTGLVINGTLTKTAVASGAGLVAYSGMTTSNYLEQPFSTNLDFGTGDFCYMGWVYNAGTDHSIIHRGPLGSITGNGVVDIWTYETASQIKSAFAGVQLTLSAASNTNHFVAYVRTGGVLYGYVNGVLASSVANTNSMTLGTSDSLYIGRGYYSTGLAGGPADRLALWRISATAPSADQIAHIYRTELPLFQPNAQCTLAGTTSSVTAMSYDEATNELHVTTAGNRSGFIDLLRVESDTLAVGTSTTVAAFEGTVITGGSTSARVYAPALNLRDELRRKEIARRALGRLPVFFDYTATASQTAFVAPKGFTVKALYKNGTLMRETTTGTYWTRSNDGFQETTTLSVGASVSDWISLMCVRA
jgi:hypothetical protein